MKRKVAKKGDTSGPSINRNWIITTVIALVLCPLIVWAIQKGWEKSAGSPNNSSIDSIPKVKQSIKADSANNSNFQQQNGNNNIQVAPGNKGDINSPKKKVTVNNIKKVDSSQTIINNGILNQGGTGNTYNQTVNAGLPLRHLQMIDYITLRAMIPRKKMNYVISIYNYDAESMAYGQEFEHYFDSLGGTEIMKPFGEILAPVPTDKKGKIDFNWMAADSSEIGIKIYPLR